MNIKMKVMSSSAETFNSRCGDATDYIGVDSVRPREVVDCKMNSMDNCW